MDLEKWLSDPAVQCVLNMDRVDDWGAMNEAEVAEYEEKAAYVRAVETDRYFNMLHRAEAAEAELQAVRMGSELGWSSFYAMKSRAEAAEATVERVRALLPLSPDYDSGLRGYGSDSMGTCEGVAAISAVDLRAALADPKEGRACPECATVHPETECPA